jgi:uncharacterized membrane protein YjfL (UPF0719 family)
VERETIIRAALGVGTTLVSLALFHLLKRMLSPKHTLVSDMRGKNAALQISHAGHVIAVLLLVPGVVRNCTRGDSVVTDAAWATAFAAAGIALIEVVGGLGVRTLMRSTLSRELDRGNVAAGVAAGANYAAVGVLASRAIAGTDLRGLGLSLVFFAIAIVTLGVYITLFRALTTYDDAEQIQGENLAAAISYAGITLASALLIGRALEGDFEGWATSLISYGWVVAVGLALYPIRQILLQGVILGHMPTVRGGPLDDAIGIDRRTGVAVMEAVTYFAAAVAIAELA